MKKILILTFLTTFLACKSEKKTNFENNNVDCCKKGTICVQDCGIEVDTLKVLVDSTEKN
jgi:hypothetical protein